MDYYENLRFPFQSYQSYPFYPFLPWADEKTRDKRRFQELYPALAGAIQPLVEEACDRLEYDGSFMFDEYPDRLLLRRLSRGIYDKLDKTPYQEELLMQETGGRELLEDFVTVMLLNEMYQRRFRRRERRFGGYY